MTAGIVTREELIERYIVRAALDEFVSGFFESAGYYSGGVLSEVTREPDGWQTGLAYELSTPLFDELWPREEDTWSDEYKTAKAMQHLLTARMFAELSAAPASWFRRAAAHNIRAVAADRLAVEEIDDARQKLRDEMERMATRRACPR